MRLSRPLLASCSLALLALAGCGEPRQPAATQPIAITPLAASDLVTATSVAGLSLIYERPVDGSRIRRLPSLEVDERGRLLDWLEVAKADGTISGYTADSSFDSTHLNVDASLVGGDVGRVVIKLVASDFSRINLHRWTMSTSCVYIFFREPGELMAQARALGFTDLAFAGMMEASAFDMPGATLFDARNAAGDPTVHWTLMANRVDGTDRLIGLVRRDREANDGTKGYYCQSLDSWAGTLRWRVREGDLAKIAPVVWETDRVAAGPARAALPPFAARLQELLEPEMAKALIGWDSADLPGRLAMERRLRALVATGAAATGHEARVQAHAARVAALDAEVATQAAAAEAKGLAATAAGWNLVRTRLAADALPARIAVPTALADADAAPLAAARRQVAGALQRLMPALALPASSSAVATTLYERGALMAGRPAADLLGLELGPAWADQTALRWTVAIGEPDASSVAVATRTESASVPYEVKEVDDAAMQAQYEANRAWARNQIADLSRAVESSDDYVKSEHYETVSYGSERGAVFNGKDGAQYGTVHYKKTEIGTRLVTDEQMKRRNDQARASLAMAQETLATGGSAALQFTTRHEVEPVPMRWQEWSGAVTRPLSVAGATPPAEPQRQPVDQRLLDTDGFARAYMHPVHQWTTREAVVADATARLERALVPDLVGVVDRALHELCAAEVAAPQRSEWTPAEREAELDWLRWLVGVEPPAARSLPAAYLQDVVSRLRSPAP